MFLLSTHLSVAAGGAFWVWKKSPSSCLQAEFQTLHFPHSALLVLLSPPPFESSSRNCKAVVGDQSSSRLRVDGSGQPVSCVWSRSLCSLLRGNPKSFATSSVWCRCLVGAWSCGGGGVGRSSVHTIPRCGLGGGWRGRRWLLMLFVGFD